MGHSTDMAVERGAVVRLQGGEPAVWFTDNRTRIVARSGDTEGAYGLVESWVPAGSGPPLHVHHRADEAFFVLSGAVRIRCGEDEFVARAGDYALLPRGIPHVFRVEGGEPLHVLTLLSPGGGEAFFTDGGRPAEGDGFPPPSPPDVARLVAAGEPYGIEILGPPMAPPVE